jgi:hypothetical protein
VDSPARRSPKIELPDQHDILFLNLQIGLPTFPTAQPTAGVRERSTIDQAHFSNPALI